MSKHFETKEKSKTLTPELKNNSLGFSPELQIRKDVDPCEDRQEEHVAKQPSESNWTQRLKTDFRQAWVPSAENAAELSAPVPEPTAFAAIS